MIVQIDIFIAQKKNLGEFSEPEFDYSVNFSCEPKDDYFIVSVYNATEEQIKQLKDKYQWIGHKETTIDVTL